MEPRARSRRKARPALVAALLAVTLTLAGAVLTTAQAADGTLSGTVTEAGGGPALAGIKVQAICWSVSGTTQGQPCGQTQTAADGTYSLALAAGTTAAASIRTNTA